LPVLDPVIHALSGKTCRALARPLMRGRATVFMLHREHHEDLGVLGHSQDELRAAIEHLRRSGARFVSLRELVASARQHGEFPPDAVAFTIDDGFADQAGLARVFVEQHVPVTVFLVTGFLDGLTWPWDDRIAMALQRCPRSEARVQLPDGAWHHSLATDADRQRAIPALQNRLKQVSQHDLETLLAAVFRELEVDIPQDPPTVHAPLTWDEVRNLEQEGVDFGPHSVTHRIFSRLDEATARRELLASRRRVQEELSRPLDIFAWPTGRSVDFTARDCGLARESGLAACFATCDDYASIADESDVDALFKLRRFSLPTTRRHLLQYGSWIERAKQVVRQPFERAAT
jgi:peptidoglycan/xylan/chitin deacetylase (PgdA/CDA1 family)